MSRHLRADLDRIEKQLLQLAAHVEDAVRNSVAAVLRRDAELAQQVKRGDAEIDDMEVELEEDCLKVLALHQPVATDLRFVTVCLKVNSDLERIGDLASNIAARGLQLMQRAAVPVPPQLESMMNAAMNMLRESIDALVRGDATRARHVCALDSEVDEQNRQTISQLMERIRESPETSESSVQLFSVSKNIERVADHATNIAEDVVYMVEGAIIRHGRDSA